MATTQSDHIYIYILHYTLPPPSRNAETIWRAFEMRAKWFYFSFYPCDAGIKTSLKTNFDFWSYYSSSAVFFPPFVWLSLFWGCYKGGGEDWNKALVWWSNIHYNTIVPQQILTSSIDSVCVLLELCCWLAAPKKGRRDRQVWRRPSFSLHERRVSTTLQGVDKCRRRRCTRFMSATPQFFFFLFKVQPKRRKKKKTFFVFFFSSSSDLCLCDSTDAAALIDYPMDIIIIIIAIRYIKTKQSS